MNVRGTRPIMIALLISSVGLLCIQLASKSVGVPPLPHRLILFVIVTDCLLVCVLLWQTWGVKKGPRSAEVTAVEAGASSTLLDTAKTLGLYAILEACACGLVSIAFRLPLKRLLFPYFLFFVPPLVALPILIQARQFRARPKSFAYRIAIAMFFFMTLIGVAMYYSGILQWLIPGPTTVGELLFFVAFITAVVGFTTYNSVYKRLVSPQS